ncbi:MAG: transporter substrate-binding domain-containing protein [Thermodesulfobacteriota bacterium]|nr:transporter substrate-binding domain-containing protein [Thermodesulfobacteriota bacterium]
MIFLRTALLALALVLTLGADRGEAQGEPLFARPLTVGTKEAPPFSMKMEDGSWRGISIDLWNEIASELNLTFDFRELDLAGLLDGVANGNLDVAVAALTITPEREKAFDFTHPFHTTGLGIAVASQTRSPWTAVLKRFFSLAFFEVLVALSTLLLGVGILVWWFERKRNPGQFGDGTVKGIGSGFWWSAVTMTTVGYGDKAPVTMGGRVVALIWMFAGIIVISSITAAITSALTVTQLESGVRGPEDLTDALVGALAESSSAIYLRENRISFDEYDTAMDGLQAVSEGMIDVLVYDAPLLRYLVNQEFRGELQVLPNTFQRQDYGIALQAGSALREPMNRVLLEKIQAPTWQDILYRYLGG